MHCCIHDSRGAVPELKRSVDTKRSTAHFAGDFFGEAFLAGDFFGEAFLAGDLPHPASGQVRVKADKLRLSLQAYCCASVHFFCEYGAVMYFGAEAKN